MKTPSETKIDGMAPVQMRRSTPSVPAVIEYKKMRFMIMDRPTNANIKTYIEVAFEIAESFIVLWLKHDEIELISPTAFFCAQIGIEKTRCTRCCKGLRAHLQRGAVEERRNQRSGKLYSDSEGKCESVLLNMYAFVRPSD